MADDETERRVDLAAAITQLDSSVRSQLSTTAAEIRIELERLRTDVTRQTADTQQVSALLAANQKRLVEDVTTLGHRVDSAIARVDANEAKIAAAQQTNKTIAAVVRWLGPGGVLLIVAAFIYLAQNGGPS